MQVNGKLRDRLQVPAGDRRGRARRAGARVRAGAGAPERRRAAEDDRRPGQARQLRRLAEPKPARRSVLRRRDTLLTASSRHARGMPSLPVSRGRALVLRAAAARAARRGRAHAGRRGCRRRTAAPPRSSPSGGGRAEARRARRGRGPQAGPVPAHRGHTRRRRGRPCGRSDRAGRHRRDQPRRAARRRDAGGGAAPRSPAGGAGRPAPAAGSASAPRPPPSWTRCPESGPSRPRRSSTTAPSTGASARSTISMRSRGSGRRGSSSSGSWCRRDRAGRLADAARVAALPRARARRTPSRAPALVLASRRRRCGVAACRPGARLPALLARTRARRLVVGQRAARALDRSVLTPEIGASAGDASSSPARCAGPIRAARTRRGEAVPRRLPSRTGAARATGRPVAAPGRHPRFRARSPLRAAPTTASTSATGSHATAFTSSSAAATGGSSAGAAGSAASQTGCAPTWRARSRPGITGERRAVLAGIVLGEDEGLVGRAPGASRPRGSTTCWPSRARTSPSSRSACSGSPGCSGSRGWPPRRRDRRDRAYVLAVGWQPSVVRAGVAGGARLARLAARRARATAGTSWRWARPSSSHGRPRRLLEPGFQLSFAAVGSIFLRVPRLRRALEGYPLPRWLRKRSPSRPRAAPRRRRSSGSSSGRSSLVAARERARHARVRPLLGSARRPLLEPLLPSAALGLAWVNGWLAAYIAGCARTSAGCRTRRSAPARRGCVRRGRRCLARAAAAAALAPPARARVRRGGRSPALVVWQSVPPRPAAATGLRITFLDVGQGDSILLQVPEGAMLVDQGRPRPTSRSSYEGSASAGSPRSSSRTATRPHRRRREYCAARRRPRPRPRLAAASDGQQAALAAAAARGVPVVEARAGTGFRLGRLRIRVLWPDGPGRRARIRTGSRSSCSRPTARRTRC